MGASHERPNRFHLWATFSPPLYIYFFRCLFEIFEESGAQPPFRIKLFRIVPVSAVLLPSPNEFRCVSRKWLARKEKPEPFIGVGYILDEFVNQLRNPRNERLLDKTHVRIIEDPGTPIPIGRDNEYGVGRTGTLFARRIKLVDKDSHRPKHKRDQGHFTYAEQLLPLRWHDSSIPDIQSPGIAARATVKPVSHRLGSIFPVGRS